MTTARPAHTGANLTLAALVLLLACACVLGGLNVRRTHADRARTAAEQQRYGAVLTAARAEAEAFINLRFDDAQASIDKVAAGATGDFRKQYDTSAEGVLRVLARNRSVMHGQVLRAGVVDIDRSRATVIAATTGTVANRRTDNKPVVRNFRLRLDLVHRDGAWLTSDLRFVG